MLLWKGSNIYFLQRYLNIFMNFCVWGVGAKDYHKHQSWHFKMMREYWHGISPDFHCTLCLKHIAELDTGMDSGQDSKPDGYIVICRTCSHCTHSDSDPYSLFLHRTGNRVRVHTRIWVRQCVIALIMMYYLTKHLQVSSLLYYLKQQSQILLRLDLWRLLLPKKWVDQLIQRG